MTLLATVYAATHLGELMLEYDFSQLRYPEQGSAAGTLPLELAMQTAPAIVLTETETQAREVMAAVKRISAEHGDSTTVASVRSIYSMLPADQPAKLRLIDHIRGQLAVATKLLPADQRQAVDSLSTLLDVSELTLRDLPEGLTAPFEDTAGRILHLVMVDASVRLDNGRDAIRFADEIGRIRTASGASYIASSSNIVFADIVRAVIADGQTAGILTLAVVLAVALFDFRRVTEALLVVTPVLAALVWLGGIMLLFDMPFDLYNIVVFPTGIGMGVDGAIHILHRYREEGPGSLRRVVATTGRALSVTAATTMAGFSGLIGVSHPGLNSMGVIALSGLACAFVASVVLLPAILQLRE